MKSKTREKIEDKFAHFCSVINFADSGMDADAIQFMNEFNKLIHQERQQAAREVLSKTRDVLGFYTTGAQVSDIIERIEQELTKEGV